MFCGMLLLAAGGEEAAGDSGADSPVVNRNAGEVFQRAFWRRLADDDQVLHAERREWRDKDGKVLRWEWYLALRPGAGLAAYLRDENPFEMKAGTGFAPREGAPDWFPKDAKDFRMEHHAAGVMTFLWRKKDGVLFASDAGGGFRPATPEPEAPPPVPTRPGKPGRLPATPPPLPEGP
jgi:hypothetical protein